MNILFDQGVPVSLWKYLPNHVIATAYEKGWATLKNGSLLDIAEAEGFEVFLTTDKKSAIRAESKPSFSGRCYVEYDKLAPY